MILVSLSPAQIYAVNLAFMFPGSLLYSFYGNNWLLFPDDVMVSSHHVMMWYSFIPQLTLFFYPWVCVMDFSMSVHNTTTLFFFFFLKCSNICNLFYVSWGFLIFFFPLEYSYFTMLVSHSSCFAYYCIISNTGLFIDQPWSGFLSFYICCCFFLFV